MAPSTAPAAGVVNAAGAIVQAQTGSTVAAANLDNQGGWLLSQRGGAGGH